MNSKTFFRATALAASMALAGCAFDGHSRMVGSSYPSYDPTVPRMANAGGPMPVALKGAPFAASDVVAAMNATPNVHQVKFGEAGVPGYMGYRVALDFGANAADPCSPAASSTLPAAAGAAQMQVTAGFCRHGGLLSRTVGFAPRPARADDPEFRRFLSAVVSELMPAFKPYGVENGSCGGTTPNC